MADPTPSLRIVLTHVVQRWGSRPDVCAQRLIGELRAQGYALVPMVPTRAMVDASIAALRRRGLSPAGPDGRPVPRALKHSHRLQDALLAGVMEVQFDFVRRPKAGGG